MNIENSRSWNHWVFIFFTVPLTLISLYSLTIFGFNKECVYKNLSFPNKIIGFFDCICQQNLPFCILVGVFWFFIIRKFLINKIKTQRQKDNGRERKSKANLEDKS